MPPQAAPRIPVIAIDGPSASGKGTVALAVAAALGFHYLNSGALYRAVALAALEAPAGLDDVPGIVEIARRIRAQFIGEKVLVDGRDVSDAIQGEAAGAAASRIAAQPAVREALLGCQREFRQAPGLVADGRDMGSVVFPDATLKVFLTASAEVRAARRHKQLMEKGMHASIDVLFRDLLARDVRDTARAVAPLQRCADAMLLDTTGMPVSEAVRRVLAQYQQAPKAP